MPRIHMPFTITLFAALAVTGVTAASAQDLTRYRNYELGSSLDHVIVETARRAQPPATLHARPAVIQELEWRTPYPSQDDRQLDPVHGIVFGFYEGALYRMVVTYDRDRTEGVTATDIIQSLGDVYGGQIPAAARRRPLDYPNSSLLAQWESAEASVSLLRGNDSPEFQLVLVSKPLGEKAWSAIAEAMRLDVIEAPRRALEQRRKAAAAAAAERDAKRSTNKAAFRP